MQFKNQMDRKCDLKIKGAANAIKNQRDRKMQFKNQRDCECNLKIKGTANAI